MMRERVRPPPLVGQQATSQPSASSGGWQRGGELAASSSAGGCVPPLVGQPATSAPGAGGRLQGCWGPQSSSDCLQPPQPAVAVQRLGCGDGLAELGRGTDAGWPPAEPSQCLGYAFTYNSSDQGRGRAAAATAGESWREDSCVQRH